MPKAALSVSPESGASSMKAVFRLHGKARNPVAVLAAPPDVAEIINVVCNGLRMAPPEPFDGQRLGTAL